MKAKGTIYLLVALVLTLAANAHAAARWDSFEPAADCDGWALIGGVKIGSSHPYIDLTYDVVLSQDGVTVEEFHGFFRVWMDPDVVPLNEFKPWATELAGTGAYDVAGTFVVPYTSDGDSVRSFTQTIDCGGDEPVCARRPGWWKRHPEAWPVESLVVAGQEFGQDDLLSFLRLVPINLQMRLARHLIAAKLNVAAGVDDTVADAIAAGDAFLAEHPMCGWLTRPERREGRAIKRELRTFNRSGCPNKSGVAAHDPEDLDFEDSDDLYDWGEVKSMYR